MVGKDWKGGVSQQTGNCWNGNGWARLGQEGWGGVPCHVPLRLGCVWLRPFSLCHPSLFFRFVQERIKASSWVFPHAESISVYVKWVVLVSSGQHQSCARASTYPAATQRFRNRNDCNLSQLSLWSQAIAHILYTDSIAVAPRVKTHFLERVILFFNHFKNS